MRAMGFPFAQIWSHLANSVGRFGRDRGNAEGDGVRGGRVGRGLPARHADEGGAQRGGDSATRAVVAGILMIIVVDAVFAVLTNVLNV
jgi:hypothetical protein